ncbi:MULTISPECIES: phosphonate metabolism transcriptional regulator PhnF [unclassified Yoonia]|uniref:phosphonate metabolism transcriptional regulator PhnF n=1 Tax=unclassified Yoonia TaxID=2629118 RepID=UPI002B00045A|nr:MULTISPECIES: phosphonate metabolism transcriptional regulator PhnF [unclassified Yoonia]
MTPRTPIWKAIADVIRDEIAEHLHRPGDKLPTESALATRFGVNRHTVRQALAALTEEGLLRPRRGAGVFVTATPTDYPIGQRVRFHQNLRAAGRSPAKKLLALETRAASNAERTALGISEGPVHVYEGLSLADGQVIALFRSVFPAARFADLPDHLRKDPSVTAALRACGVADYTRASTRITAKLASATQALHLQITEGGPILRTSSINVDVEGIPVEAGLTWFAGDKVTLTLAED